MGKRLGELTRENTKCMVKVREQTLIERMIRQLSESNVKRIIIVVGYKGEKVKALIGNKINNTPILYIENKIYDKTNNIYSLYLAKDFLIEDETLLLESDLIFADSILEKLIADPYPNLAVVAKYQSWMDGTVVTLDEDNNILNFISKKAFVFAHKDSYYKTVNIYKFSKEFSMNKYVPFLEAYCKALGNNEYYEQVLKVISLLDKPDLKALKIEGEKWDEIDELQELNKEESLVRGGETGVILIRRALWRILALPYVVRLLLFGQSLFPELAPERGIEIQLRHPFNGISIRYADKRPVSRPIYGRFPGPNHRRERGRRVNQ